MTAISRGLPPPSELESIVAHLGDLLNAPRASAPVDEHYGMPDIIAAVHNFPAGVATLQRMIADLIEQYEPRLTGVVVRPLELSTEKLTLSFEIRARLHGGAPLRIETKMNRGGHITVT